MLDNLKNNEKMWVMLILVFFIVVGYFLGKWLAGL